MVGASAHSVPGTILFNSVRTPKANEGGQVKAVVVGSESKEGSGKRAVRLVLDAAQICVGVLSFFFRGFELRRALTRSIYVRMPLLCSGHRAGRMRVISGRGLGNLSFSFLRANTSMISFIFALACFVFGAFSFARWGS